MRFTIQQVKKTALFLFSLTIFLIPLRWRINLYPRINEGVYSDYTDILLFAIDIAMLGTLAVWGISLLLKKRAVTLGSNFIWIPLVGLTAFGWISILTSVDPTISFYHAVRLSLLFLFYLYIVNEFKEWIWLIAPLCFQLLFQAGVALSQFSAQHSIGLKFFQELELNPIWSGVSIVSVNEIRFLRAYGLSDHPNILGGCLSFGLIILLGYYLFGQKRQRTWLALAIIPSALALFYTFSRSAWIAFFIGALFLLTASFKERKVLKNISVIFLAILIFISPILWANRALIGVRFNASDSFNGATVENQSINERILLINSANKIFENHALFGVGLGASPIALKENFPDFPVNYQPPHFTLLTSSLEIGIFGGLFYFLLLALPLFIFFINLKSNILNKNLVIATALLLTITFIGMFDYYTWLLAPGRVWQWFAWGLWSAALEDKSQNELS
jgi:O-antigen ligase